MYYIGVDLAARFSAAVKLDEDGKVHSQWDSWGMTPWDFCLKTRNESEDSILMVEDLPYGLSRQAQIKPPLRVQGMLIAYVVSDFELFSNTYFIAPATWQRHFDGVWKQGASGAESAAVLLGYSAPDLLTEYADDVPPLGPSHAKERSKIRGQLKKASTDYNDAFLIAEYTRQKHKETTLDKIQGIQRI